MLSPDDIKRELGYGGQSEVAREVGRSVVHVWSVIGYYDKQGQLVRREEAPPYPVRQEIARRLGLSMRQVFGTSTPPTARASK